MTKQSFIYFLDDGTAIKIGRSATANRQNELQGGNPRQLLLRGYILGGQEIENNLHTRFAATRITHINTYGNEFLSEWFEYSPELLDFIRDVAAPNLPFEHRKKPLDAICMLFSDSA